MKKRKNRGSVAPGRSDVSGLELVGLWHVDEDNTYDVDSRSVNRGTYIAVLTFNGSGRFDIHGRPVICTEADHAIFIRRLDLQRYRTRADRWCFWWFEFRAIGPVHFPLYTQIPINVSQEDKSLFDEIFSAIRRDRIEDRRLASGLFTAMLYRWLLDVSLETVESLHEARIRQVVDLMHEHLDGSLRLNEMARNAGMGERTFRTQFARVMAASPKQYYNRLRLDMARNLLEMGTYQVGEVADRLGFSSPFHLSKAYRAQFGHPPSAEFHRNSRV